MDFYATDFLRKENGKIKTETIINVINWWELDRCAEAEESLFDIQKEGDFIYILKRYGIKTANKLYNEGRYYFAGNNFDEPKSTTLPYLLAMINDVFDIDFFKDVEENGMLDTLSDYFEVDKIRELIKGNAKGETKFKINFFGTKEEFAELMDFLQSKDYIEKFVYTGNPFKK